MMEQSIFKTSQGWMGLAGSERGVRIIILPKASRRAVEEALHKEFTIAKNGARPKPASSLRSKPPQGSARILREAQAQLRSFMDKKRSTLDFPVDLSGGTPFQRRVWRAILNIPYGRVRSYQWVAARVGGRRYARAVGNALGANPVPVIVPCHRVLAHDGSLGGFSGGLPAKRLLLALEGSLAQLGRRPHHERRAENRARRRTAIG